MLKLNLSPDDHAALQKNVYIYPHPVMQKKANALLMHSSGVTVAQISKIIGCCQNTICNYIHAYNQKGIKSVEELNFYKPQSELVQHADTLKEYFENNPPSSLAHASQMIEDLLGIKRSRTQVRKFLLSIGLKCRKVAAIPAKADPEAQEAFLNTQLNPVLEAAQKGEKKVYFLDAAHFVLGAYLAYLWSAVRIFIKTPAGRKRYNVLGALDAITKEIICITNDTYINSSTICEMLKKLTTLSNNLPIVLVLDNARYQRCKVVMDCAKELGIELLFLPPYSPNLNLIERYWKFLKKHCLNNKYYSDFNLFKNAIDDCIVKSNDNKKMKNEMNSLLTLKFQTFSNKKAA